MAFPKGVSGNPGGRPKAHAEIRQALADNLPSVVETLAAMLKSSEPENVRFAVKTFLEYTLSKPAPEVAATQTATLTELGAEVRDYLRARLA